MNSPPTDDGGGKKKKPAKPKPSPKKSSSSKKSSSKKEAANKVIEMANLGELSKQQREEITENTNFILGNGDAISNSSSTHSNRHQTRTAGSDMPPVTNKRVTLHTDYSDETPPDETIVLKKKQQQKQLMPPNVTFQQQLNEEEASKVEYIIPPDCLFMPRSAAVRVEMFAKYVWKSGWRVMPHHALPNWLSDNDFLLKGHRPPLPSIKACCKSVFRLHTETGNIWTHLIGAISFIGIAIYFLTRPEIEMKFQEKFIFGTFFASSIICLLCSALFHTFYCHSPKISKLFNKIDYCGISVLIMGSFVPWLYYAFYCDAVPKIGYLVLIAILGFSCIVVSLWDKFSTPQFRAVRAGMFIALGLSGVIPGVHYMISVGLQKAFNVGAMGWLLLMATLYIFGAVLYAARIPERLFPGRFDIWFQSHQIFHVFVVIAAYVHYHGITKLASYRLTVGDCLSAQIESDFSFEF